MVWTRDDTQIHAHGVLGQAPLIPRTSNVALLELSKDEAMDLIHEISEAFGISGVPSSSHDDKIYLIIENPTRFYPKDKD